MQPGEVMAACQANCAQARDLALEASPLYQPLAELAREGFTGTVAELHTRLDSMVCDAMRRSVRALTVDNCYAVWHALGFCGTFPSIIIYDETAAAAICSAVGTNVQTEASVTVTKPSIASGDTIDVELGTLPLICQANNNTLTIEMVYH
jgi:hypothetical protein